MKEEIQNHFQGRYYDFYSKYLKGNIKKIGGQEYQTLCPFHEEKNPSFNFNNEKGTYFCHGCNQKGHAFHLYAKMHNFDDRRDFPKILEGICSDFGIPYEKQEKKLGCYQTIP